MAKKPSPFEGYKGDMGSSPLDGVVSFIDGIRHGGRKAKQRAQDIKDAPRRKMEDLKSKTTVDKCKITGHKGKRGSNCSRCGNKLL